MYNDYNYNNEDQHNGTYHYSYRSDGGNGQGVYHSYSTPVEMKPVKKKRTGLKVTVLVFNVIKNGTHYHLTVSGE